ncbi:MAG: riboflavin synthase [Verrucomicrobiota bacterium]
MFTGIIEETGQVESIQRSGSGIQLRVRARRCAKGLKLGDSLAVNGCCLTVVRVASADGQGKTLQFDLLQETWERTSFQEVRPGTRVNLERALKVEGRLDGHFVTGHIDGIGHIQKWEQQGKDHVLEIAAPRELMRYIVFKGSIAVDGISLTVAAVKRLSFQLWIIPHTLEVTNLKEKKVGGLVNLETDILAKYVEKLVRS